MSKVKSFNEFQEAILNSKLIKILHEGVRMVKIDSLNEGNFTDHADFEIDLAQRKAAKKGDTLIIQEFIPEIKSLIKKFGDSGQSGGSAPYTAGAITNALKKLLAFEPLGGIENIDEEWNDCSDMGGDTEESKRMFQNRRLSSVFKDGKDGRPYYLDGIIFKGNNDITFTGNSVKMPDGSKLGSANYIKKFPFEPKSFVIDVIETEWADKEEKVKKEGGGWWTSVIKDPSQLDEVWEHYDRMQRK